MSDAETNREIETGESAVQLRYAAVLRFGVTGSISILVVTYALYVSGVVEAYVPLDELPSYYGMSASEYMQRTGIESGWSWALKLGYGEFLGLIGVAMLGSLTIVCYLSVMPLLASRKDRAYLALAIAQALVLAVAASGVLTAVR